MNKKITWSIVAIVVIILIAVSVTQKKGEVVSSSKPFKIGIVLPLSGPAGALGEASKKAAELAIENLTAEEKAAIEVVYADDQLDPKQSVTATQKLIEVDKVDALITYSSGSSVAASYVAEKAGIPMIGLGNGADINTGKKWVTRYMLGPVPQASAIEAQLLKGKYERIAIVWNQSDGPKSVHDALIKILTEGGYNIVADESVTRTETDFKTPISKIKAAKPDVVVTYISPQIGVFGKQAKDFQLNVPLVSGPVFEIVDQLKSAQGGLDNQLFVGNDNMKFVDDFYTKNSSYPTIAGDYLYDAITRIAEAAKEGDRTKEALTSFIRKDFQGVAGTYVYNPDGSFVTTQVVKKWNGTKFEVVK